MTLQLFDGVLGIAHRRRSRGDGSGCGTSRWSLTSDRTGPCVKHRRRKANDWVRASLAMNQVPNNKTEQTFLGKRMPAQVPLFSQSFFPKSGRPPLGTLLDSRKTVLLFSSHTRPESTGQAGRRSFCAFISAKSLCDHQFGLRPSIAARPAATDLTGLA